MRQNPNMSVPGQRPPPTGPAGAPTPAGKDPNPWSKMWVVFIVLLLTNYLIMRVFSPGDEAVTIPYTEFKQQVANGNVESIYSQGAKHRRAIPQACKRTHSGRNGNPCRSVIIAAHCQGQHIQDAVA